MIKLNYAGRFGNKIYQYCIGRILAEELKLNYIVEPLEHFNNALSIEFNKTELNSDLPIEILKGHHLNLNKIIMNKTERNIIIKDGYFQRYEYYKKYKEKIKNEWLYIEKNKYILHDDDLVIHIRSGDIWEKWWLDGNAYPWQPGLPISFYKNIIELEKPRNIYFVTERIDDPVYLKLKELYPMGIEIHHEEFIEDFIFLLHAKKLVMSVSTFSWWAAWLSNATTIYYPMTGFFHINTNRYELSFIVDDESRYQFIDLGINDNWIGNKKDELYVLNH